MTRKTCIKPSHVDIVLQSVCSDIITRQNSKSKPSFLSLDNQRLIRIDGVALGKDELKQLVRHIIDSSMARNRMPRTRTSSACCKAKQTPVLPDYGHRLRTRKHTSFANHFTDTSGDDDSNLVKPMRELRSSSKSAIQNKQVESDTWESGRPKRACIKRKKLLADARYVMNNRSYYSVDLSNSKSRSNASNREMEISRKIKSPPSDDSEDDKCIYRSRKLRFSELTRLHNEAENFLFPHKDESTSDDDTDGDYLNASPVTNKKGDSTVSSSDSNSRTNKAIKPEPEESSMDSTSSETSSVKRKRRRLTQAEAFILDNQRYYKFETPGSRLRYQGSYLSPIVSKNNGEYNSTTKSSKSKEPPVEAEKKPFSLEDVKFSFEIVPTAESWYKTFQRQDNGEEYYICYSSDNPGFYKPVLLPYEMGPLPPLDPRVCLQKYNQLKKRVLGENAASSSTASGKASSLSCSAASSARANHSSIADEDESKDCPEIIPRRGRPPLRQGASRKRGLFLPGKNPRKSPRQHASTLAILSLLQQRKRRETHKPRTSDPNSSKHCLSIIEEESDYEVLAKSINDMLSANASSEDSFELSTDEGLNVNCKPDAIAALEDFVNYGDIVDVAVATSKLPVDGSTVTVRKPNRKKKKNRTGWPNKNRRTVFRKDDSNSRDGHGSSEHENSPNVRTDSEKNTKEHTEPSNSNRNKKGVRLKLSNCTRRRNTNRNSSTKDKVNGDVQVHPDKLNGVNNDSYEFSFKGATGMPKRKEHRESSSDNCAEVVIASVGDRMDCVNVDLDMWENAERVLTAKIRNEAITNDFQLQPIVRVQKLDSDTVKLAEKQVPSTPSPPRRSQSRRMPASPKSPRMLRRPRGGWYRDRYNNNNNN